MRLTYEGLKDRQAWEAAGVVLPSYDPAELAERTRKDPVWVHFGIGNIFRIFIGGIADTLIRKGLMDRGITCAETFDYEVADRIYKPFDNLVMAVTLHEDGRCDKQVLGSLAEAVRADSSNEAEWARLKEVFVNPGLQLVSFTITEKGYALKDPDGRYFGYVRSDIEKGPDHAAGAMGVVTAMLYERFKAAGAPLALVSMDNVSQNGKKLRESVLEMAEAWKTEGFVGDDFLTWLKNESCITFPWSMIDKITPRPGESVCRMLEECGIEDMEPVVTSKHTYIAPYANAEAPQYLVVEDAFPNGRPPLEEAGVYMTDRETVNKSERMKVTTCLNPLHTSLAIFGCLLGYTRISDEMKDDTLVTLIKKMGYDEGLKVVTDPKILSPEAFIKEVIEERLPNPYIPDAPQRIATDTSLKVPIRFGETIKSYIASEELDVTSLTFIPLTIAGWFRYLLAINDEGEAMELSSDPLLSELQKELKDVKFGQPETAFGNLDGLLRNKSLFAADLVECGLKPKIENMLSEMLKSKGAVRETLTKYTAV